MSKQLMAAQDILLNKINQLCGKFGLNNIMAQLYAVLYLSDKPLSLNDMAESLKISKGSVSVNIRALERYGVVRQLWVKGSRKDYYEAETDISKVIMERIQSMAQGRLSEIEKMINDTYDALKSASPGDDEEKKAMETFMARLEELRSFYDKAKSMFDLFRMSFISGSFRPESRDMGQEQPNLINNKV